MCPFVSSLICLVDSLCLLIATFSLCAFVGVWVSQSPSLPLSFVVFLFQLHPHFSFLHPENVHWVPISILVILERSPFSIYLFCSLFFCFFVCCFREEVWKKVEKRRSGWKSTLTTSSFLYIHQLNRRELIPCNIKMKEEPPPSGVNSKTSKSSVVSGTCTLVNSFSSINCQVIIMTIKSYT